MEQTAPRERGKKPSKSLPPIILTADSTKLSDPTVIAQLNRPRGSESARTETPPDPLLEQKKRDEAR